MSMEDREDILKRLRETGDNETICLDGEQVKTLLDYIDELERERA